MPDEPFRMTAAEAATAIAEGRLTSEALVRSCLARIEARDPLVRAWSWVDPAHAIAQARECDKRPAIGPLHGVPVGIKDMIDTEDMPTQHNSPIYVGHRPGQDAACVSLLRSAGAVILGKTDTHEFAAGGRLPLTRNPRNLGHTPGGSSSGSAAAVADGMVCLALGTQTAGSLIRPASFCGIFGMKPSWGRVSREGAKLYSLTLDTIGWHGRSVQDLARVAMAFGVIDALPAPPEIATLRIGLLRTAQWHLADPCAQDAVLDAAARLRAAGATVEDVTLPDGFNSLPDEQGRIMRFDGQAAFLPEYRADHARLHQDFRDRVENSDATSVSDYLAALDHAASLRPVFDAIGAGYDALLTPTARGEAPASLRSTGDPLFSRMWTLLHVPCITVPGWTGPNGLPIGVQFVAARYADSHLLSVATAAADALQARTAALP